MKKEDNKIIYFEFSCCIKKAFPIVLLLVAFSLFADVSSDDSWVGKNETFYMKTLSKELIDADFYELQQRGRALGIEEKDTKAAYITAISDFYGIKVISEPIKSGEKIILERAGELKMIKFRETGEENLHIVGKARIIINGKNEENVAVKREIEADEIFIDLKNKELSGIGNVIYIDDMLEFKGDQFYYNFKINKGTLLSGRTKIKQKNKSGLEGAFFTGERITYLGSEESILYNGKLTTCDAEDPHYYIQVSRLWLNKDSEWGLLNGVVHVGPIPFLYFPVYYHPKSIDINPSIGYRTREGWFAQTTYSIIGKIDTGADSADTKKATDFGVSARRKQPESKDMFVITKGEVDKFLNEYYDGKPFYKKYPQMRILPDFNSISISMKVFTDAYTNLGFYYGGFFYFKMEHQRFPIELAILTDYAFSRRLWEDTESDQYLTYNPADKTKTLTEDIETNKKNTYFYPENNPLQFRNSQYAILNGELFKNIMSLKYSLQLEYASDKSFYEDFYDRNYTFSYIDLLSSFLQYSIESKDKGGSIFTSGDDDDDKVGVQTKISNFANISFSPNNIPDIFGWKPLSSVSISAKSGAYLTSQAVSKYAAANIDNAIDPKAERYFLDYIDVPELTASASGTFFDYEIASKMNEKVNQYKDKKKLDKVKIKLQETVKKIYSNIDIVNAIDSTTDKTVIDYKYLLPFFSPVSDLKSASTNNEMKDYYSSALTDGTYKERWWDDKKKDEKKTASIYDTILSVDKSANKSDFDKKFLIFSLGYDVSETLKNKYYFNTKADTVYDDYDNVMEIMTNKFDFDKKVMRLNTLNSFAANINGNLGLFKLYQNSGSLISFTPKLSYKYKNSVDDMSIYALYLGILDDTVTNELKLKYNLLYENRLATEYTLTYSDKMSNDLSFGSYFFNGTGIDTTFNMDIYEYNEQKAHNFDVLNKINSAMNTADYQPVDSGEYFKLKKVQDQIKDLYSEFKMKFNLLPEGSDHSLDLSAGPKINYIIPSSALTELKNELWTEEYKSIYYTWSQVKDALDKSDLTTDELDVNKITDQAKDYIYYRNSGKNLSSKREEFFYKENFFEGRKNFRSIFESFNISSNYNYKQGSLVVFGMSVSTTINLLNAGVFSNGDGGKMPFGIYPNVSFSMKALNSIFDYKLTHTYTKEFDNKLYDSNADKNKVYDDYNLMTFANNHVFTMRVPGTLFDFKLPSGDWFNFSSTTNLVYNKNKKWNNEYIEDYYLYLKTQTFKLGIMMDILSITLNMKPYYFVDGGYNIVIDNGAIKIGHNITEIPKIFNLLKITMNPSINYVFTPMQNDYYNDSGVVQTRPQTYYENNKLEFSFGIALLFGEKKDYQTTIKFESMSNNTKLYRYYTDDVEVSFFDDLMKSFNFANEQDRRDSNFNLQKILFSIEHKLHDWNLYFEYSGKPEKDYTGKKYIWDNTFIFKITWNLDTKNQLMKLFNKTKLDNKYEKGQWRPPSLSLDLDEE